MNVYERCRRKIITCIGCNKKFMNKKHHHHHLHMMKKNSSCVNYYNNIAKASNIASSFQSTELRIPATTRTSSSAPFASSSSSASSSTNNHQHFFDNRYYTINKVENSDLLASSSKPNHKKQKTTSMDTAKRITTEDPNDADNFLITSDNDDQNYENHNEQDPESTLFMTSTTNSTIDPNSTIGATVLLNDNEEEESQVPPTSSHDNENTTSLVIHTAENSMSSNQENPNKRRIIEGLLREEDAEVFDQNLLIYLEQIRLEETPRNSNLADRLYRDGLELIKYLIEKDYSLSSYDDLMKWKYGVVNTSHFMTLQRLKKHSETRVHGVSFSKLLSPKRTNLQCPSGRQVTVITTNAIAAIVSLLSKLDMMNIKHTTLSQSNNDNPFEIESSSNSTTYSDINTGSVFVESARKLVNDSTKQYNIGIIMNMDEATMDAYSKLSLHPVNITFTTFNRERRNLSSYWRTIGYLPNFDEQIGGSKRYSPDDKLNDLHFSLKHILSSIQCLQESTKLEGMKWKFQFSNYPGVTFERRLTFTISHIISDAKEHDALCGRMQNRSKCRRLCRDCDIQIESSDDPYGNCNFWKMEDIQNFDDDQKH